MTDPEASNPVRTFCRLSLCALAISVSLGVALVSLSKALLLLAFVALLVQSIWLTQGRGAHPSTDQSRSKPARLARPIPVHFETHWAIYAALGWMALSVLWTEAPTPTWTTALLRHARFLVLPLGMFCLNERADVMAVLRALVLAQLVIVVLSCLLWLGVDVPLHNPVYPMNFGLVINGHLEQPIMSTLMLVVLWHFKEELFPGVSAVWIYLACAMTVGNVLFVMTGRTGFIAMIVAVTLILVKHSPSALKHKITWVLITPVVLSMTLGWVSPRFYARITEGVHDVELYTQGFDATSQGYRLDYWHQSIKSLAEAPLMGHGVGSWRQEYIRFGGDEPNPPSNPHEQFLLWWVEAGVVGLIFMGLIFVAMWRDARRLEEPAQSAMQATWAITLMVSLFNCPFYGAGMGEFFLIIFACLLALGKPGMKTHRVLGHPTLNHSGPAHSDFKEALGLPKAMFTLATSSPSWIERLGLMVVTQPLSKPVPGNERNYQQSEGLRKLGYRQLRKLVYLQLHSQRHLMCERAQAEWKKGLWIYERTAQIGDCLMDLAPRSLLKKHGLEMDLLTLPHLAQLFEFDPCFGHVLTDARAAKLNRYDFVVVQSVHHRALIKKITYFRDLPWLCIQGFYDVPDFSRMRWSTQRLMDWFDRPGDASSVEDALSFEAHARQKLWLPPAVPSLQTQTQTQIQIQIQIQKAAYTTAAHPAPTHELVLALGGVDPVRTYHRWPELLVLLSGLGFTSCSLIGKGEVALKSAKDIEDLNQDWMRIDNQINRTTLIECAQILARTKLLITADGGMMHLAISSGTGHIISLFTQGIDPEYRLPKDLIGQALQSVDQDLNRITPGEIVNKIHELSLF